MDLPAVRKVIDMWANQFTELGSLPWVKNVQIFENRGAMMGASNPHPHCQIWANESLPNEADKELQSQSEYHQKNGSCLLCDYLKLERKNGERIVCENDDFVALVPFWAVWPYETMLLSKHHLSGLDELADTQRTSLADIILRLNIRYDNLFRISFPYTMGFHQRPTDDHPHPAWHFHAHYYPPLLRSAAIPKFMVGYEMLGSPQRDITAEYAAERLQKLEEIHYTKEG
jgi:UDPglucose--hexose-1-phosphate uridylyltransferase